MSTIKLFNKAFKGKEVDYKEISELATKVGYLVHPECATNEVKEFLESQKIDLKSTFYQTWEDVTSKNRFELFIDQVIHYLSTYGTNHEGEPALPDKTADIPDFKKFKTILPIEKEEAIDRCEGMLSSGIALTQETIEDVFGILDKCKYKVDIDIVKNKEAKMLICKEKGLYPNEPAEFVRYLIYLATDRTLLIKDRKTLEEIKNCGISIVGHIEGFTNPKNQLASVFHRFKPVFLAFKKANKSNIGVINRLRRQANKYHKPLKKSYWETLLSDFKGIGELPKRIEDLNNFKKITLLEAINVKLSDNEINVYPIRNGKMWLDTEKKKEANKDTLKLIHSIIYQSLVDSVKEKAVKIKIPKGVDIKLPKSGKSFVGNYPLGTSFDLSDSNAIVGINWKEVDGARDLDLSLTDLDGRKFGWNSDFYNESKSVVYSGDVTSANPEATELFYASAGFKPSIVKVNNYSGEPNSKFKFFVAREEIKGMKSNYMVDPNNILFTVDMAMESKQMSLGVITENKFIVSRFRSGSKQVSGKSVTDQYIQYTLNTLDCYVGLEKLLKDAGFEFVEEEPEIDLTELSKDTLIEILN